MRYMTKTATLLVASLALSMVLAASAIAALPEFIAAKSTVSFTAESGKVKLNAQNNGVLGGVECEHSKITGTIVSKSPTVEKAQITLSGHCVVLWGSERLACFEPLPSNLLKGTLGFIKDEEKGPIGLKLHGESTSVIFSFSCLGATTYIEGTVVGEFPEISRKGLNQYNHRRSEFELKYAASGVKQAVQTLLTSKGFETGLHLTASGLFGGEASLEAVEALKPAEEVEIKA